LRGLKIGLLTGIGQEVVEMSFRTPPIPLSMLFIISAKILNESPATIRPGPFDACPTALVTG
jgi:hypothetical protein